MQIANQGKPEILSRHDRSRTQQHPHDKKPHFSHSSTLFFVKIYTPTKITDFNRNILFSGKNYALRRLGHSLCAVNQPKQPQSINFSAYEDTLLFHPKSHGMCIVSHAVRSAPALGADPCGRQGFRTSNRFRRSSVDRCFGFDQRGVYPGKLHRRGWTIHAIGPAGRHTGILLHRISNPRNSLHGSLSAKRYADCSYDRSGRCRSSGACPAHS